MRQSSLSFPSFASDCMVFFVSLWLTMKILALAVKNIQASLIFLARLFVSLPPELYKSVIMALHIIDHPLVLHKLSIMRDKNTSTMKFRGLLEEIAMFMGYEITRDLPLTYEDIETPLMPMKAPKIAGKKVVQEQHPDVDIYLASLDEGLNDKNYILPGLGDAGDRIFGTK